MQYEQGDSSYASIDLGTSIFHHIVFSKATTIREGGFCHFHNVMSDEKAGRNFWERVILELNVCKYHHWFYSNSIFIVVFFALITSPIILNGGYHMLAPLLLLFILCNSFQLFSTVTKKPLWSGDKYNFSLLRLNSLSPLSACARGHPANHQCWYLWDNISWDNILE